MRLRSLLLTFARAGGSYLAAALVAVLPAACGERVPTAPAAGTAALARGTATDSAVVVPPLALAWFAPLGDATADAAVFDATAMPVVEVCAWTGTTCRGASVARFRTAPTAGDAPLTVDTVAGRYEASWSLADPRFTTRQTYRIRVLQGARELGALSVDVVRGRWALTRSDGTLAPLAAAATLPIRFRVAPASSAVERIGPEGGTVRTPDGRVTLVVPAGAVDTVLPIHVTRGTGEAPPAILRGTPLGEQWNLGPSGTRFGVPVRVTLNYAGNAAAEAVGDAVGVLHWNASGTLAEVVTATHANRQPVVRFTLDQFSSFDLVRQPNEGFGFAVYQVRWGIPVVRWALVRPTAPYTYLTHDRVAAAFALWGEQINTLRFEEAQNPESANIRVTEDANPTCSRFGAYEAVTLGIACYGRDAARLYSTLSDTDRVLVKVHAGINPGKGFKTLAHEIGHAIGIAHPYLFMRGDAGFIDCETAPVEICPIMAQGGFVRTQLHPSDIAAVQYLYGRRGDPRALVNGRTYDGRIDTPGAYDTWTFTAAKGDYFVVSAGETGAPSPRFVPWVLVYDSTGKLIADNAGESIGEVARSAPVTGTYTVRVASGDAGINIPTTGTGDYRLTFIRSAGPLETSPDDEGGPLVIGTTQPGHIYTGDVDAWTVRATKKAMVIVSVGETGTPSRTFGPQITLVGPTGKVIDVSRGTATAQIGGQVPDSGTYTILVETGYGGINVPAQGVGDYRLTVATSDGPVAVSIDDQGGPMTNGATYTGAIYPGDIDTWTVDAKRGDFLYLGMGETSAPSPEFWPWIRLIAPDGKLLDSEFDAFGVASQVSATAPVTGRYTVVVGSGDQIVGQTVGTGAGGYRLTLAQVPGTPKPSPGDEGGELTGTVNGTIYVGDVDAWTLPAKAGDTLTIRMVEGAGASRTFTPAIGLIDPTGKQIGGDAGASQAEVQQVVRLDGTYTVLVSTGDTGINIAQYAGSGPYTLSATRRAPSPPPSLATRGAGPR